MNAGATACVGSLCAAGKYGQRGATTAAVATCADCEAGTYWTADGAGASECTKCEKGKFSKEIGAKVADICSRCVAGKYSDQTGATKCKNCVRGKHLDTTGVSLKNFRPE